MSPEKSEALLRDFPHLFQDRHFSPNQIPSGFDFECGDGWEPLIRKASKKIELILVKTIDAAIKAKDFDALDYIPIATQVKEKFGTLRFYMSHTTDEIELFIEEAEEKSTITCEQCGKAGKLRGKNWFYTACDTCFKKVETKHGK